MKKGQYTENQRRRVRRTDAYLKRMSYPCPEYHTRQAGCAKARRDREGATNASGTQSGKPRRESQIEAYVLEAQKQNEKAPECRGMRWAAGGGRAKRVVKDWENPRRLRAEERSLRLRRTEAKDELTKKRGERNGRRALAYECAWLKTGRWAKVDGAQNESRLRKQMVRIQTRSRAEKGTLRLQRTEAKDEPTNDKKRGERDGRGALAYEHAWLKTGRWAKVDGAQIESRLRKQMTTSVGQQAAAYQRACKGIEEESHYQEHQTERIVTIAGIQGAREPNRSLHLRSTEAKCKRGYLNAGARNGRRAEVKQGTCKRTGTGGPNGGACDGQPTSARVRGGEALGAGVSAREAEGGPKGGGVRRARRVSGESSKDTGTTWGGQQAKGGMRERQHHIGGISAQNGPETSFASTVSPLGVGSEGN
ncbi:hypothetical protein K438DRAFT_1774339 [Mycena galopus ATCC 62051]|nr:hypothetical protein K438DRAFT_1774339 [Mycena galopus ATCC 62051]